MAALLSLSLGLQRRQVRMMVSKEPRMARGRKLPHRRPVDRATEVALLHQVQASVAVAELRAELTGEQPGTAKRRAKGPAADAPSMDEAVAASAGVSVEEIVAVEAAGRAAREALCRAHVGLVSAEAWRLSFESKVDMTFADLKQEGFIGLTRAMEKFDLKRAEKVRFSSYATFYIKEAMQRALHWNGRPVRLPVSQYKKWDKVKRAATEIEQRLGREATQAEIAEVTGMKVEVIEKLKGYMTQRVRSLEQMAGERQKSSWGAGIAVGDETADQEDELVGVEPTPEEFLEEGEWVQMLQRVLPPKEVDVVMLKYGGDSIKKNAEVGKILGLGRSAMSWRLNNAMDRLRADIERGDVNEEAIRAFQHSLEQGSEGVRTA